MATSPTGAATPFRSAMLDVVNKIHSAPSTKDIIVGLKDEIQALFSAERMTIYALNTKNQQLYSVSAVGGELKEIRVPKSFTSLAGFCGLSRRTVNVANAYDKAELAKHHPKLQFDPSWDQKSGLRTKEVLCVPITNDKFLLGVVQLVNKKGGGPFTPEEVAGLEEVAKTLGIAFYNQNRTTTAAKPTKYAGLVAKGAVSEQDIQTAAAEARMKNHSVERILIERFSVNKEDIVASIAKFYAIPPFNYTGSETVPDDLKDRLNVDFCRKNSWAPIGRSGREVVVVVDDPHDLAKMDAIQATNLSAKLEFVVGIKDDIQQLLNDTFGEEDDDDDDDDDWDEDDLVAVEEGAEEESGPDEQDSEVVKLANRIIRDAWKSGVSDIHIEPYGDKAKTVVRFRQDGACAVYKEIRPELRNALVSRYKIMARLDISEKRKPQDGKIRFQSKKGQIELRVATVPTAGGNEDIVMRILAASEPIPLDKMGFSDRNLTQWKELLKKPYGIVLVVGPTGSGKTTTLHSGLGYINTPDKKIWTAEDPVEITQKGLRQCQVMPKIDFTFAAAMRSFLRCDPDVIMVGEMRDRETTQMGIEASLTGHIVFSTLHTNSAAETITRLLDMDIDPFSFADALLGIMAQRLVRTLCVECKEEYHPNQEEYQEIVDSFGPEEWASRGVPYTPDFKLWKPVGCQKCAGKGFRGRMGIHELIVSSEPLKELIVEKAPIAQIHAQAIADGMESLMQDGIMKVLKGLTTLGTVRSVCMK